MNFLHGYLPETGEFLGYTPAPDPVQVLAWEAAGATVVNSPRKANPASAYNYIGGTLTPKIKVGFTLLPLIKSTPADGVSEAVVAVFVMGTTKPPAEIDVLINGQAETVTLTSGVGELSPIVSPTPTTVTIGVVDEIAYATDGKEVKFV